MKLNLKKIYISPEKKVFAGFFINIIVVLALAWITFKKDQNDKAVAEAEDYRQKALIQLERIRTATRTTDENTDLYVITKNEKYVSATTDAIYLLRTNVRHLSEFTREYPEQQKEVDDLEKLINRKITYIIRIIEFRKYKSFNDASGELVTEESSGLTEKIEGQIKSIEDAVNGSIEENKSRHIRLDTALNWTAFALFVCLTALLFIVYFIIKWYLKGMKDAQSALQTNAHLLQSIINNTSNPIFIKDISGKYLLINKNFENRFHRSIEETKGKTDHDLFPKEIADRLRIGDIEAVKTGKGVRLEELVPEDDGLHTYISMKFPLYDSKGNLYGVGGIATDITERKKLEQELEHNEKQLQALYMAAPEAVIAINEESRITNWNPKATLLFGWTEEEALGNYMHELIMPARYRKLHLQGLRHFISTGEGPFLNKTIEVSAMHKNGNEFDIELSISPCMINGKYIFIGFLRDITERNKLRKDILESRKFLHSIIENIPSMIMVKNAKDLTYIEVNRASELLGYSKSKIIGKTNYDLFSNEQAQELTAADKQMLKQKKAIEIPEETIATPKGPRVIRTQKLPIFDESGNIDYILDISEDITKQKELEKERNEAEKQLRVNEARMKLILENIGEGVIVADQDENVVLLNSMAKEILAPNENFYDWSDQYEIYYADGQTLFPAQHLPLERAIKGKSTSEMELLLKNIKTGEEKKIKVTGSPVKDERNNIVAGVTTIRDITKYKALERALEESEIKYRNLIGFKREKE